MHHYKGTSFKICHQKLRQLWSLPKWDKISWPTAIGRVSNYVYMYLSILKKNWSQKNTKSTPSSIAFPPTSPWQPCRFRAKIFLQLNASIKGPSPYGRRGEWWTWTYPLGEKGTAPAKKTPILGFQMLVFLGGFYLDRNDLGGTTNRNVRIFTVLRIPLPSRAHLIFFWLMGCYLDAASWSVSMIVDPTAECNSGRENVGIKHTCQKWWNVFVYFSLRKVSRSARIQNLRGAL